LRNTTQNLLISRKDRSFVGRRLVSLESLASSLEEALDLVDVSFEDFQFGVDFLPLHSLSVELIQDAFDGFASSISPILHLQCQRLQNLLLGF